MRHIEQQELPLKVDCRCPGGSCIDVFDHEACTACISRICLIICPAGLFEPAGSMVVVNKDGLCLECGACRLVCDNVDFHFPQGGTGIIHKFG